VERQGLTQAGGGSGVQDIRSAHAPQGKSQGQPGELISIGC
jgi:hypothetical protein